MFNVIRKFSWIFILILITVAAIPEIPSKGKQLTRISDTQSANDDSMPRFAEPIPNVTVSVGRDALLACVVENLKGYKVAWVRVDTQTILSIHHNVITQNSRISLSYNDHRSWYLHIKEVEESDRGWYMCQVNTDPMRSRKGYLQVVVPPMIIESMTSNDMVVREGTNVTLMCKARGYPEPYVMWRREDGEEMNIGGENVNVVDGEILQITKVSRLHMAAYLCVASNGVPPSISKRVHLRVQFPPMLSIANQLEGAYVGQEVTLECETEAYPASINYWTTERGDMIISDTSRAGDKFETTSLTRGYQKFMKLKIRNVGANDFGSYRCVAKNSLGETDGIIKLDEIPTPTTAVVSGDITILNRTLAGKRPHNRKFEPNAIPDYGLEEWKDGGDTNQPPSVRHPPGAFHNKASSGYSINSHYNFIKLNWLRRPFDNIKSSTLFLIQQTSFLWYAGTKIPSIQTTMESILKNNIISPILIISPNNNTNQHNSDNNHNNILGKFINQQQHYNNIKKLQKQENLSKKNTVIAVKSMTQIKFSKFSKINDSCYYYLYRSYSCNSSSYSYNYSSKVNKKCLNILLYYYRNNNNDINNEINIAGHNNSDDDNIILFLIQILKRILFIFYEKINFHIISRIIEFIRMNFHIFIMLALNLISVNLVKNILLLPEVIIISSTSTTLFKSTKIIVTNSTLLSTSSKSKSSTSTSSTSSTNSTFQLEKILEKNIINKRTLSPTLLITKIKKPLNNNIDGSNSYLMNCASSLRFISRRHSNNINITISTVNNFNNDNNNNNNNITTIGVDNNDDNNEDDDDDDHNDEDDDDDRKIFTNLENNNINTSKNYYINLNESINMSKTTVLPSTKTVTTIKTSTVKR